MSRGARAVLGAIAVLVAVLPAAATAAPSGSATLTIGVGAARALEARGITIAAAAPARRAARTVVLPVVAAQVTPARADLGGRLRLRRGARSIVLAAPRVTLGATPAISAVVGGRRRTIWRLTPQRGGVQADARTGALRVASARGVLTTTVRDLLRRRLGGRPLPRQDAVRLTLDAATGTPAPAPAPAPAARCGVQRTGGTPPDTGSGEPPVKARPGGALDVVSATVSWHPRESFVRYMASGEGAEASNGATADPDGFTFHFPFARGWCDPATGAVAVTHGGTVAFRWRSRGIDLVVNDPEVEIDGASSRVIFRMTGSGSTAGGGRRAVIETLDLSKAASATTSADGRTLTYERIPGAIPPGGDASFFGGYYLPGDEFGWVSIAFTTA